MLRYMKKCVQLIFCYFRRMFLCRPTNLVSYFSSESVENVRLIRILLAESLIFFFFSLNECSTKIKLQKYSSTQRLEPFRRSSYATNRSAVSEQKQR